MTEIDALMRENIRNLAPYKSARTEFTGKAEVELDANENWRTFVREERRNRYPDPLASRLRRKIEEVLGLPFEKTVVGNGSDELIDLFFRIFCNPGTDKALIMPPTYGVYKVFADTNQTETVPVPLTADFALDKAAVLKKIADDPAVKLLFICSPNNPSGNAFPLDEIEEIAASFRGITIVDEAYFEFADTVSAVTLIDKNPRIAVLRTLSKCWGLASARIGILTCSPEIHAAFMKTKYPYNVSGPSQDLAFEALSQADEVKKTLRGIIFERGRMEKELVKLPIVKKVYPSVSNFLLVKTADADGIYKKLLEKGIIIRNRTREYGCENCLRFTIGSESENTRLLEALKLISEGA